MEPVSPLRGLKESRRVPHRFTVGYDLSSLTGLAKGTRAICSLAIQVAFGCGSAALGCAFAVLELLTGGLLPGDWSSWTLCSNCSRPGKRIRMRLSFFCGRKRPTSDFGIEAARTFLCNVSCRSRARNGSSREELQAPIGVSGPDWPGQQQKSFPVESRCAALAGIHVL